MELGSDWSLAVGGGWCHLLFLYVVHTSMEAVLHRGANFRCLEGMDLAPTPYYWPSLDFGGSPPLGTRSGWMALACMPFVLYVSNRFGR